MPEAVAATTVATPLTAVAAVDDPTSAVSMARFAQSLNQSLLNGAGTGATVSLGAMVVASAGSAAGTSLGAAAGLATASAATAAGGGTRGLAAMGVGRLVGGNGAALGSVPTTADGRKIAAVTNFAFDQLGKPYVFGTAGPNTFDCSGLVSATYKQAGVEMPAYTFTQATYGRAVDPASEPIRPGDLIFVRGGRPAQDLGHVGMAISANEWVQAPHTGDVVKIGPLPYDRIQVVRRIIG